MKIREYKRLTAIHTVLRKESCLQQLQKRFSRTILYFSQVVLTCLNASEFIECFNRSFVMRRLFERGVNFKTVFLKSLTTVTINQFVDII